MKFQEMLCQFFLPVSHNNYSSFEDNNNGKRLSTRLPCRLVLFFLSPYTASRPRGHSRQVGAVVLKEEGKYRQKNKDGIVRG